MQRIRNVLHVTGRRCYNIPGTSFKLLEEDLTQCQKRRASYLQKISKRTVAGTCCKSREEDVTTYQEHLASYLKKSLQRMRKVVQVTYK